MNIESTDSWTQGLSHTACTTPTPAFTGTLNIPHTKRLLASKSPPFLFSAPVSFFLVLFFNPLNMFWYKNKPTYDESTMLVNCLSLLPSCYCPVLSCPVPHPADEHTILAPKTSLFLFTFSSWTLDTVWCGDGGGGDSTKKKKKNSLINLPEKKKAIKKIS